MHDTWLGLSESAAREEVRRAMAWHDERASLTFVDSAQELRSRVLASQVRVGVIVGLTEGDVSALNVAAALKHDAVAAEVVLVVRELDERMAGMARQAGIDAVIGLSNIPIGREDDLDEPSLPEDDLPTMIVDAMPQRSLLPNRLPSIRAEQTVSRAVPLASSRSLGPVREEDIIVLGSAELAVTSPSKKEETGEHALDLHAARASCGPQAKAPILVFVSGRGGVGKTSIVAAMAVAAASWGMRVALLDLDLTCGNLYSLFGLKGPADLASLSEERDVTADQVLACGREAREHIMLWGGCELPEMAETVLPKTGDILASIAAHNDVVLVDTSVTFTDAVAQAAQQCSRLIVVVDDRPGSAVAQRRLGSLAVRLGVARTRIARLANKCGPRGKGEPQINRADLGLETARPLRVLEGGVEVTECLAAGRPEDLVDLGSRFQESAASTLASLLAELGALPNHANAKQALETRTERPRWTFGRRKEAV